MTKTEQQNVLKIIKLMNFINFKKLTLNYEFQRNMFSPSNKSRSIKTESILH